MAKALVIFVIIISNYLTQSSEIAQIANERRNRFRRTVDMVKWVNGNLGDILAGKHVTMEPLGSAHPLPGSSVPQDSSTVVNNVGSRLRQSQCGNPKIKPKTNHRIIGGMEAIPHSFPWQVSLQYSGQHFCGGVLIDTKFVLTAAHCVENYQVQSIQVVLGAHDINKMEPTQVKSSVKSIIRHPSYDRPNSRSNDFSIIELEQVVAISDYISPLCLPETNVTSDVQCVISGWGWNGTATPNTLQQVHVPILSWSSCNSSYGNQVDDTMMCAGYEQGGKDSCHGDSGGPLACFNPSQNKWQLLGITSWGLDCALPQKPGVYARVLSALSWITQQI